MPYIHELPDWPDFHWDRTRLEPLLGEVRYRQGLLLGRMRNLGFATQEESSLATLTEDVVKSSAIEGEILNPAEVRSSIARRLGIETAGLPPASRSVDGIVEMMVDATRNHGSPLTAERLFAWHAALFPTGRSGMTRITVGAWRTGDAGAMQVVSGPLGKERVHFEAPVANRVPAEMDAFLEWCGTDHPLDPVVRAGAAHLRFVTIHPFDDGNGRIGRAIADWLLVRADGKSERFYSLSASIEARRTEYYLQLERAQRGTLDITGWLEWFLNCMLHALAGTDRTLAMVLRKNRIWEIANGAGIIPRQRKVIDRLLDGFEGHLTTPKYAKIARCSEDTALRDIRFLMDRGILLQNPGGGRSTSYRLRET